MNSTFIPVCCSRYLPSGTNLRCNSVGASSGIADTFSVPCADAVVAITQKRPTAPIARILETTTITYEWGLRNGNECRAGMPNGDRVDYARWPAGMTDVQG